MVLFSDGLGQVHYAGYHVGHCVWPWILRKVNTKVEDLQRILGFLVFLAFIVAILANI